MKFAMAIVVVAIHTRPELSFSSPVVVGLFEAVYTISVPFFFMASGFPKPLSNSLIALT